VIICEKNEEWAIYKCCLVVISGRDYKHLRVVVQGFANKLNKFCRLYIGWLIDNFTITNIAVFDFCSLDVRNLFTPG